MTRLEKLDYMKNFYPRLFAILEQNVPFVVENTGFMTDKDAEECNIYIAKYCMERNNPQLLNFLRL